MLLVRAAAVAAQWDRRSPSALFENVETCIRHGWQCGFSEMHMPEVKPCVRMEMKAELRAVLKPMTHVLAAPTTDAMEGNDARNTKGEASCRPSLQS